MKKWLLVLFTLMVSVAFVGAASQQVATMQLVPSNNIIADGEMVPVTGSGFLPGDQIRFVLVDYLDANRMSLGLQKVETYNITIDAAGNLTGTVVLENIPSNAAYAFLMPFAEKTNIRVSQFVEVSGNAGIRFLEPKSGIQTAGTVSIFDSAVGTRNANGDGIADNSEDIDLEGSGWTGSLLGLSQREYDNPTGSGTYTVATNLSTTNASITGGNLTGYTTTSASYDATTKSIRILVINDAFESTESNAMLTPDTVNPNLIDAVATSLTNIQVKFDEQVEESGGDAGAKFVLSGTTVTVTAADPVNGGTLDTLWNLTLSGPLPNRAASGVTIAYDQTASTGGQLQDAAGNEVNTTSPAINVRDNIAPAQPTLTNPTNTTIMTTSVTLQATADDATTDPSMSGVTFQGSNDGTTWTNLGTDNNTTDTQYSYTYTFGTKWAYYRAVAADTSGATSASSATNDLSDAHRIEFTDSVTALDPNTRGKFRVNIQNNYADSVTYGSNLAINLTSSSSTGTFYDAATGGSAITQVVIAAGSYGASFWYEDSSPGITATLTATEAASNLDDPSDAVDVAINNYTVDHFAVTTANSQTETAGTAFNITVTAHDASHNVVTNYTGSHTLTWSSNATASPDGTNPVLPADGSYTFTDGVLTVANGGTLYNSAETPYIRVTDENSFPTSTTEGAGQAVTVNDAAPSEVVIKTAADTGEEQYSANVYPDSSFQGPTQANPDKSTAVAAVIYDAYGNLISASDNGAWSFETTTLGTFADPNNSQTTLTFDNTSLSGTTYSSRLIYTASATYSSVAGTSLATITVDDAAGATVTNFNVITDDQDNRYVIASWDGASSGDDGTTGTPTDYDIRWTDEANGPIDTEAEWNAATSVGTAGKPAFSVGSWRIDMSGFPAGNKYFAIRTYDDVNNVSVLGSGSYTTTSDYSLPVELSLFEAQDGYGKVTLRWVTQSETNNEGFFLYRAESENGVFTQLNNKIIPGQGNSNTLHEYEYVDENVEEGKTYYYKIASKDFDGTLNEFPQVVSATVMEVPKTFAISQNYPNPFNPSTQFRISIAKAGHATLEIYNVVGQRIRTLFSGRLMEPGVYDNIRWDARDDNGNLVSNGVYYYVFTVKEHNFRQVRKMIFMK